MGDKIKEIGSRARVDMEKSLKSKVFLKLSVAIKSKKMKIKDEGIYLFSKKHGEKFLILNILSKSNGLIRCLSRTSKKTIF